MGGSAPGGPGGGFAGHGLEAGVADWASTGLADTVYAGLHPLYSRVHAGQANGELGLQGLDLAALRPGGRPFAAFFRKVHFGDILPVPQLGQVMLGVGQAGFDLGPLVLQELALTGEELGAGGR